MTCGTKEIMFGPCIIEIYPKFRFIKLHTKKETTPAPAGRIPTQANLGRETTPAPAGRITTQAKVGKETTPAQVGKDITLAPIGKSISQTLPDRETGTGMERLFLL